METGIIFDISHYMLEDGPGIRTNVFFKGCYLKCKWCSNAYGLEKKIQLSYDPKRCIGCRACISVCGSGAIDWDEVRQVSVQDFAACTDCVKCTSVCPAKARNRIGREAFVKDIVREVERDRLFYRRGEGGVTLSGGEILMQAAFARDVLKQCRYEGINTAIETSGFGKWEDLKEILAYCDSVFMDCKCMDPEKHKELTGVDNRLILENIRLAAEYCKEKEIRLVIRLPLIPTLNDDEKNLKETAGFVDSLPGRPLLNVLPFHNFGAPKYEFLGKRYPAEGLEPQGQKELKRAGEILDLTGVGYSIGGYDI